MKTHGSLDLHGAHAEKMMQGRKVGDKVKMVVHGKIARMESRQDMGGLFDTTPGGENMAEGKKKPKMVMHHSISMDVHKIDPAAEEDGETASDNEPDSSNGQSL